MTAHTDVLNPALPPVAGLIDPRIRMVIYVLSIMAGPAFAIVSANVELHWGILAGYAAWNALVGFLAYSNTPSGQQAYRERDGGFINGDNVVWTLVGILLIVALIIWLLRNA